MAAAANRWQRGRKTLQADALTKGGPGDRRTDSNGDGEEGVICQPVIRDGRRRSEHQRAPTEGGCGRQHYTTFVVELLQNERNEVHRTHVVDVRTGLEQTWPGRVKEPAEVRRRSSRPQPLAAISCTPASGRVRWSVLDTPHASTEVYKCLDQERPNRISQEF